MIGRLIGIEHLQNRAFDRESESHQKKKIERKILILRIEKFLYFDSFLI